MMASQKPSSTLITALIALLTLSGAAVQAAVSVDFRQGANNEKSGTVTGLGNIHWTNSIVQTSNSVLFEGMSIPQRMILTGFSGTSITLKFSHQFTKSGTHAYDFLTSWPQTEATAEAELSQFMGSAVMYSMNVCGEDIGPPKTLAATCASLPYSFEYTLPTDSFISKDGAVDTRIKQYESVYGDHLVNGKRQDRVMMLYADAPITSASLAISHSVGNGLDTSDSDVLYALTVVTSSTATILKIETAAHLSIGIGGEPLLPGWWGAGLGASQINGGPYHFKLDTLTVNQPKATVYSLGQQDNQVKGGDIKAPPPLCPVDSGPSTLCPNKTETYSATTDAFTASYEWYIDGTNGTIIGATNGPTVTVQAGTVCGGTFDLCVIVTRSSDGQQSTCCKTITVQDTDLPSITCPTIGPYQCESLVPGPYATLAEFKAAGGTASDTCDKNLTFTLQGSTPLTNGCGGSITRTYRVTDDCGNYAECTQTIVVDDTENPTASNPEPATVQCKDGIPVPDVTVVDDENDNCGTPTVTFVGDASDGKTCPEVITRTYRVTDSCDNYIDVTQTITIDDTIKPTASDADPVTVQCKGDLPKPDVTVVDDEADNCTATPTVEFVGDVSNNGTCPEIITRTYKVSDDCGNSTEVKQTITIDDTINPTASNPAPIVVECADDVPPPDPLVVTDEKDNCTAAPKVEFLSATAPEGSCPTTFTRTYRVTDDCDNYIDVVQQVTIDDNTNPTASNPAPIVVECADDVPPPDPLVVTDEKDNCGVPKVEFLEDVSDGKKCPETITRTYKVTDACNNSILVHQTITVDDITPPEVTCATGTYTVYLTLDNPASKDNCGVTKTPVFTRSDHLGQSDPYPVGQLTIVTITVEDDCGNVSTCTYNIDLRGLGPVTPAS